MSIDTLNRFEIDESIPQVKRRYYNESKKGVERLLKEIKDSIDVSQLKILDIGFGPGHMIEELGKEHNVYGIDLDEDWINLAKKRFRNNDIQILKANAEFLPFKNDCFDLVICNFVLPYLYHDEQALSNIAKILKKDGILFLNLHGIGYYIYRIFTNRNLSLIYKILSLFSGIINQFYNKKIFVSPDTYQVLYKFKRFFKKNNMKILYCKYYDSWYGIKKFFIIMGKKMR